MKLEGQLWFTHNGENLAGQARMALLTQIAACGSISQAAKAAGMSYKTAWDAVEAMNAIAGSPLVSRSVGGKGGGGAHLTAAGEQLVAAFARYQQAHVDFLRDLDSDQVVQPYLHLMQRLRVTTSARNQLLARVRQIDSGEHTDGIVLELQGGQPLIASITQASTRRLGLQVGVDVFALIKAPWVELVAGADAPVRNALPGTVSSIEVGVQDTEVLLELAGGAHLAISVSSAQAAALQLHEGQALTACIRPEQIILCAV